jgi:uncharacterized protein YegP (UPF0339 family)
MRFEVYQDGGGEWRWRLLASNGAVVAVSAEGYRKNSDCWAVMNLVQDFAAMANVVEI